MREEQPYERLLQALQDMKSEIAKQIRPVEEQIIQANVEHLRQSFSQESRRLAKCLEEIDDNILACRQYLQDYDRIRFGLQSLNERRRFIAGLGWLADPGSGRDYPVSHRAFEVPGKNLASCGFPAAGLFFLRSVWQCDSACTQYYWSSDFPQTTGVAQL